MASDEPSQTRQRSGLTELLSVFQRARDSAPRDPGPAAATRGGGSANFRESWQAWRRSRPFWGGLLMLLGGLELMVIPLSGVLGHGAIKLVIYIGIGGVFGVLIGVLLVVCGILLWLHPVHRTFYGIAGVVLGILSFPASNLGGFFLGMLLAIVGGAMAFAWTPLAEPPVTAKPNAQFSGGRPAQAESSGGGPAHAELASSGAPEGDPETTPMSAVSAESGKHAEPAKPAEARLPRRMAIAAMPLLLTAGLLGSPGANAAPAAPHQVCILWIFCFPSPNPSPTPSPSPSASLPGLPGVPGVRSPSPSPSASPTPASKNAPGTPGLVAATATSVIKAGSAGLTDFAYQGAAMLPTAGGRVQMMKFTASALTLSGGVAATVTQNGVTTTTTSSALDFSGSVVLYATQLSGCIGPLCVTLTPANVLTGLLKLVGPVTSHVSLTLTSVTTDQPLVLAGALQANGLSISLG